MAPSNYYTYFDHDKILCNTIKTIIQKDAIFCEDGIMKLLGGDNSYQINTFQPLLLLVQLLLSWSLAFSHDTFQFVYRSIHESVNKYSNSGYILTSTLNLLWLEFSIAKEILWRYEEKILYDELSEFVIIWLPIKSERFILLLRISKLFGRVLSLIRYQLLLAIIISIQSHDQIRTWILGHDREFFFFLSIPKVFYLLFELFLANFNITYTGVNFSQFTKIAIKSKLGVNRTTIKLDNNYLVNLFYVSNNRTHF